MVRTRNAEKSAKDETSQEQTTEQPIENTRESPVAASDNKDNSSSDGKKDDAASKARERMDRFKALKARAVSGTQMSRASQFAWPICIGMLTKS
jgi:pre-mRNA-splicing factor SYF2